MPTEWKVTLRDTQWPRLAKYVCFVSDNEVDTPMDQLQAAEEAVKAHGGYVVGVKKMEYYR